MNSKLAILSGCLWVWAALAVAGKTELPGDGDAAADACLEQFNGGHPWIACRATFEPDAQSREAILQMTLGDLLTKSLQDRFASAGLTSCAGADAYDDLVALPLRQELTAKRLQVALGTENCRFHDTSSSSPEVCPPRSRSSILSTFVTVMLP